MSRSVVRSVSRRIADRVAAEIWRVCKNKKPGEQLSRGVVMGLLLSVHLGAGGGGGTGYLVVYR